MGSILTTPKPTQSRTDTRRQQRLHLCIASCGNKINLELHYGCNIHPKYVNQQCVITLMSSIRRIKTDILIFIQYFDTGDWVKIQQYPKVPPYSIFGDKVRSKPVKLCYTHPQTYNKMIQIPSTPKDKYKADCYSEGHENAQYNSNSDGSCHYYSNTTVNWSFHVISGEILVKSCKYSAQQHYTLLQPLLAQMYW